MLQQQKASKLLDFSQLKIYLTESHQFSMGMQYLTVLMYYDNNLSVEHAEATPKILIAKIKSRQNIKVIIHTDYIPHSRVVSAVTVANVKMIVAKGDAVHMLPLWSIIYHMHTINPEFYAQWKD